jgi:YggT family protein
MALVAAVLWVIGQLYLLAMIVRLVIELVAAFARSWQPRGATVVVVESVFTVTDPPIKLVRRLIPPLRIGALHIDLAFAVVLLVLSIVVSWLGALAVTS